MLWAKYFNAHVLACPRKSYLDYAYARAMRCGACSAACPTPWQYRYIIDNLGNKSSPVVVCPVVVDTRAAVSLALSTVSGSADASGMPVAHAHCSTSRHPMIRQRVPGSHAICPLSFVMASQLGGRILRPPMWHKHSGWHRRHAPCHRRRAAGRGCDASALAHHGHDVQPELEVRALAGRGFPSTFLVPGIDAISNVWYS